MIQPAHDAWAREEAAWAEQRADEAAFDAYMNQLTDDMIDTCADATVPAEWCEKEQDALYKFARNVWALARETT